MRRPKIQIFEDSLLDESPLLTRSDLGLSIDLARDDFDDNDSLGFRSFFEHPEAVIGASSSFEAG